MLCAWKGDILYEGKTVGGQNSFTIFGHKSIEWAVLKLDRDGHCLRQSVCEGNSEIVHCLTGKLFLCDTMSVTVNIRVSYYKCSFP